MFYVDGDDDQPIPKGDEDIVLSLDDENGEEDWVLDEDK